MAYLVSPGAWNNLSRAVMIASKDGTNLTRYPTDKTLISLTFSPDGNYLLSDDHDRLYVLNLETSAFNQFSGIPSDWSTLYPSWQPPISENH